MLPTSLYVRQETGRDCRKSCTLRPRLTHCVAHEARRSGAAPNDTCLVRNVVEFITTAFRRTQKTCQGLQAAMDRNGGGDVSPSHIGDAGLSPRTLVATSVLLQTGFPRVIALMVGPAAHVSRDVAWEAIQAAPLLTDGLIGLTELSTRDPVDEVYCAVSCLTGLSRTVLAVTSRRITPCALKNKAQVSNVDL